jgi:hypothetical protein
VETERWLPVVGWEGLYEVSDQGRVRSLDRIVHTKAGWSRRHQGRTLRSLQCHGYQTVELTSGHRVSVHRLVLEAFVGPCPDGLECCHGVGGPSDNRLSNLRWDTRSENMYDRCRHGTDHHRNKENCPRGHSLKTPNLVAAVARAGHRKCLACDRAHADEQRAQARNAPFNFQLSADRHFATIMAGTARIYQGDQTHCLRRHLLVNPNLVAYELAKGFRNCLSCARARSNAKYAARHGKHLDLASEADRQYAMIMAAAEPMER